jgi:tRNA/rRNA methyltransferase
MSLSFILVEPARAANVGAAARAMKTMGFAELIMVSSEVDEDQEAHWVAHGATDILHRVRRADSLKRLREDFDLLIGTTARERGRPRQYLKPEELKARLTDYQGGRIGLVFGRESSGLTNDELELCDLYTSVPMPNDYPSLNLAQAVMVYSYALSGIDRRIGLCQTPAPEAQLQALKDKAEILLDKLSIGDDDKLKAWLLDGVALLKSRDCRMAHQLANDLLKHLGS